MGNPQHLDWLFEGVAAWNARRAREDFEPDFEGVDLVAEARERGKLPKDGRLNLWGADLREANLREANLRRASLREAILRGADLGRAIIEGASLYEAKLREADLSGADLRETDLGETDLWGSNLSGADLREAILKGADLWEARLTTVYSVVSINDGGAPKYTNLGNTRDLLQVQLEEAIGDTGVILPEGLVHPAHWEVLEGEAEAPGDGLVSPGTEDGETDNANGEVAPIGPDGEIISNLVKHAALHKLHAKDTAAQMRVAVSAALPAGANQIPLVFRITQDMADVLEAFADQTEDSEEALRARIAELEAQVAKLIAALEDAEARAEAEAVLAERLQGELEAATAEDGVFLAKFKEAAGEQTARLPFFLFKGGLLYYLAASLGPNHPLVKLLFEIVGKL